MVFISDFGPFLLIESVQIIGTMFVLNLDMESPKLVSVLYNYIDEGIGLPKTEGK